MNKEIVLVIGSKPVAILPDINPKIIYVANGAAERAIMYKKKFPLTKIISVTSHTGLGHEEVRSKIEKLKPNEIIFVNGRFDVENFFEKKWLRNVNLRFIEKKGLELQKKYFSNITLRLADLGLVFGSGNILFGILRLLYALIIKRKNPMGLTTGCLCILIALLENKNSKILVTGIGLEGGRHFYKSKGAFPSYRGWADSYLLKRLPLYLKLRILTTDVAFSQKANIKLFKR